MRKLFVIKQMRTQRLNDKDAHFGTNPQNLKIQHFWIPIQDLRPRIQAGGTSIREGTSGAPVLPMLNLTRTDGLFDQTMVGAL